MRIKKLSKKSRKINYIITQVTLAILFAIFYTLRRYRSYEDGLCDISLLRARASETMPLKRSRLITAFSERRGSNERAGGLEDGKKKKTGLGARELRSDMNELHIISICKSKRQRRRRREPTEFSVNLASTAELTEHTTGAPASAIYCKSIALTRPALTSSAARVRSSATNNTSLQGINYMLPVAAYKSHN